MNKFTRKFKSIDWEKVMFKVAPYAPYLVMVLIGIVLSINLIEFVRREFEDNAIYPIVLIFAFQLIIKMFHALIGVPDRVRGNYR